jgi:hypothetical protein
MVQTYFVTGSPMGMSHGVSCIPGVCTMWADTVSLSQESPSTGMSGYSALKNCRRKFLG